jgi:hypothetical protein
MVKHIYEKFFTADKINSYNVTTTYSIYVNPDSHEFEQFIYPEARAFIDRNGNLYVEGSEDKDSYAKFNPKGISHYYFLKTLQPQIIGMRENFINDYYTAKYHGRESKVGIGVYADTQEQLRMSTQYFYPVSDLDFNQARILFAKCVKKNPNLRRLVKSSNERDKDYMIYDVTNPPEIIKND